MAAAGSGQRRRGGVLRVTRVTTTGTRVVGRGPGTSARTIRHSYRVVEHDFYEKSKKKLKSSRPTVYPVLNSIKPGDIAELHFCLFPPKLRVVYALHGLNPLSATWHRGDLAVRSFFGVR